MPTENLSIYTTNGKMVIFFSLGSAPCFDLGGEATARFQLSMGDRL